MEKQSACDMLLYRTYQKTWKRGENYANEGKVKIKDWNEKSVSAVVSGIKDYQTELAFRGGGISRSCTCPVSDFCKHMVAVAILWDELRGLTRPSVEEMEAESVPPPLVSRAEINQLFSGDPLQADLSTLRIYASEWGSWSRPHARLPDKPKISEEPSKPLARDEVEKALKEIESWGRHRNYDSYFCAGEMAAAFSELLDIIDTRSDASQPEELIAILGKCVEWYYREFTQMIDGSDGVWIFPHVRIGKLTAHILKEHPQHESWKDFHKTVKEVGKWWGEPDLDKETIATWKDARL